MNGVAQGIEYGTDLFIDFCRQMDGVECRNLQILRESARYIDPDTLGFGIEVEMPGTRHAALHPDEMALAGHPVADFDGAHMSADLGNHA